MNVPSDIHAIVTTLLQFHTMIHHIIKSLADVSSRTSKAQILQQHKDNELLQRFFKLALDPMITFGIRKIPFHTPTAVPSQTLEGAFDSLTRLHDRSLTGHAAVKFVSDTLNSMTTEDADVLVRVIEKEPRCGVQLSTCNTIWGSDFILDFPVMKASPRTPESMARMTYPAISQEKLDGARTALVVRGGIVTVYSSSGREMLTHGVFDHIAQLGQDFVLDGEMLVLDSKNKVMTRKAGNGIINKALKNTISQPESERLLFVAFDLIPYDDWIKQSCDIACEQRFESLTKLCKHFQSNIDLVTSVWVNSEAEAIAHFNELHHGLKKEGTILKMRTGVWRNVRSLTDIKFKGILTCDLRVVGIIPGTGKNTGKIGSLVCESADGLLKVNVGSGLSDADRVANDFVGQIVEVEYNEKITSKGEDSVWSLFLPRYVRIRTDKANADTLDLIV